MLEMNVKAITAILLFCLLCCAVAILGGFLEERDKQSGECYPVETRTDRIHYQCKDGRDYWRINKMPQRPGVK